MNWKILRRYLEGSCSEQELRQLGEWLQENPANEDFFKTYIEQWDPEESGNFEADVQVAWQHFKKRYNFPSRSESIEILSTAKKRAIYTNSSKTHKRGYLYWFSFAAAAMVLIVSLVWAGQPWVEVEEQAGNTEIATQEITTSKGQRTNLKLSDGSLVTLNAESKLKIPENYGEPDRTLYLKGEAFFEVQHDETHPFIVITPRGYVKDLGTQFNITAYDSNQVEVALKEGLASLGEVEEGILKEELVELSPNKLGILKQGGRFTISDINDIQTFTGWAEGKLVFKQTPFPEVVERLERWFDIECVVEDPQLTERTLTATYSDMPLDEVLKVLSISVRATFEREKRQVTFQDNI